MPITVPSNYTNHRTSAVHDDLHPDEARWFAVRVGHRKEKVVAKLLDIEGVTYFLPLRERPFKYKSKTGVRQIPLLGGYIFVRIVASQQLQVQRLNFVFGFIKIGKERRQVTQAEIDLLRRLSIDNTIEWVVEEKLQELESGTVVEIARGPLAGVRGYYLHAKTKKKFIISFGGLDARLMTCEVSPEDIIPLPGMDAVKETQNQDRKKLW